MGQVFLLGALCYLIYPLVGWVLARLFRVAPHLRGTYICMAIFSNNAFMGFPVISALFGEQSIFYANIFHMTANLVFFTLGIRLIRRDAMLGELPQGAAGEAPAQGGVSAASDAPMRGGASADDTPAPKRRPSFASIRLILNNGVLAASGALLIYFAKIPMHPVLAETLHFVGNLSMPLSMLVIGSSMGGLALKDLIPNRAMIGVTAARLALMPAITYFILGSFLRGNTDLAKIITMTVGMPIASLVSMGTAAYDKQGREAAVAVVFSTLCSVFSIPLLYLAIR